MPEPDAIVLVVKSRLVTGHLPHQDSTCPRLSGASVLRSRLTRLVFRRI